MSRLIVVSLSGGKDSTATAILALREKEPTRFVFADTGNEHALTLEYVHDYLPRQLGLRVDTVRADFTQRIAAKRQYILSHWEADGVPAAHVREALDVLEPTGIPFLDLCLWKGRFPSRKAQFCTQELKRYPLDAYLLDRLAAGGHAPVESWRGVRRDESRQRASAIAREQMAEGYWVVHPVLEWTAQQVIDFVRQAGVVLNPLYTQGMRRVGCMPCINVAKDELIEIAVRFPEHIDKIRTWERLLCRAAKRGWTTFFAGAADADEPAESIYDRLCIDARVEWAKTARGGQQYDWLRMLEHPTCASSYGLCE